MVFLNELEGGQIPLLPFLLGYISLGHSEYKMPCALTWKQTWKTLTQHLGAHIDVQISGRAVCPSTESSREHDSKGLQQ